jgi:hypothetical protein
VLVLTLRCATIGVCIHVGLVLRTPGSGIRRCRHCSLSSHIFYLRRTPALRRERADERAAARRQSGVVLQVLLVLSILLFVLEPPQFESCFARHVTWTRWSAGAKLLSATVLPPHVKLVRINLIVSVCVKFLHEQFLLVGR